MKLVPFYQKVVNIQQSAILGYEATIKGYSGNQWIGAESILGAAALAYETASLDNKIHAIVTENAPENGLLFINCEINTLLEKRLMLPSNVDCSRIVLEITERTPFDAECLEISDYLRPFRDHGMKLAIDDFGVGFANFQWVANLSPDYLKIDRSLIAGIHEKVHLQRFVHGILEFSKSIGTEIIAEGVETKKEHQFLLRSGLTFAQGFYYHKPEPAFKSEAVAY